MRRPEAWCRMITSLAGWRESAVSPRALRAALTRLDATEGAGSAHDDGAAARIDRLIDELAVSESWFFREPKALDHAVHHTRQVVRTRPACLVSLPCAAGEEPYSLLLAALRAGLDPAALQVWGLDLSARVIARARRAVYGARAFREPGQAATLRDRHFEPQGACWRLREAVRRRVRLEQCNALDARWAALVGPVDVLLCRNLLIYLTDQARDALLAIAARALRPDGLLIVASAEAGLLVGSPHFAHAPGAPITVLRRQTARDASRAPSVRPPPPASGPRRFGPTAPTIPEPNRRGQPPGLQSAPVPATDTVEALVRARALADGGQLAEAEVLLRRQTAAASLDPEPYRLLGAVLAARGDRPGAEASLRRAIYLDPHDALTRLHLVHLVGRSRPADAHRPTATSRGGGRT